MSNHYIDIHTHQLYTDNTLSVYNAFLTKPDASQKQYSMGIYPWYINDGPTQVIQLANQLRSDEQIIAIGECGLDKKIELALEDQISVFEAQIELANNYHKPLIIHCVGAYNECLALLKQAQTPVIFHGFNKHLQLAQQIVDAGHHISIGALAMQQPNKVKSYISNLPFTNIFLETDTSEIHISTVYQAVADLAGISVSELINTIQQNFAKICSN